LALGKIWSQKEWKWLSGFWKVFQRYLRPSSSSSLELNRCVLFRRWLKRSHGLHDLGLKSLHFFVLGFDKYLREPFSAIVKDAVHFLHEGLGENGRAW